MYHAHWLQSLQFLNQGYIWTLVVKSLYIPVEDWAPGNRWTNPFRCGASAVSEAMQCYLCNFVEYK